MLDLAEDHVGAKILLIDIETTPILGWAWQKYETNIIHIEKDWGLLSVAWKWLHKTKVDAICVGDVTERRLVNDVWKLLNAADIVVAHNGDRFDIKKLQTKMKQYKLDPPSPFKTVDTLKIAKGHFAFSSNKLDDLSKSLNLGKKVETGGFQLWLDCMSGSSAAYKKMKSYNKKDVELLEKLYLELRPWTPRHPNMGVHVGSDEAVCGTCGSDNIGRRGYYHTNTMSYPRYKCNDCGNWGRFRRGVQRGSIGIVCDRK